MGIDSEKYRRWVREVITDPRHKLVLSAALDAYDRVSGRPDASADEIRPLVDAMLDRSSVVWQNASEAFIPLARTHSVVVDAMRAMLASANAEFRFRVVASLGPSVPTSFAQEAILVGLQDRSQRVRIKAAEAAESLGLRDLIPALETRLASESSAEVARSFRFHLALLRDGYLLEKSERGTPRLVVRTTGGGCSSPSDDIVQRAIDEGQLEQLIRSIREGSQ